MSLKYRERSVGANPYAIQKTSMYEKYRNISYYMKLVAFSKQLDHEMAVIDDLTKDVCDSILSRVPNDVKYSLLQIRDFQNLSRISRETYMRCRIKGVKSLILSRGWNAVFAKLVGLQPRKIGGGVQGTVSIGSSNGIPVIIKTGFEIIKNSELIHEFLVGIYLNKLYTISEHFPTMYGILEGCDIPYITQDMLLTNACNISEFSERIGDNTIQTRSTHILLEKVNGRTLRDIITAWITKLNHSWLHSSRQNHKTLSDQISRDLFLILIQTFCVLSVAYKHYKFIHGDLHTSNIMIVTSEKYKDRRYQLSETIVTVRSKYKVVFIDFGLSTIRVNCNIYTNGTLKYNDKDLNLDSATGADMPWFDVVRLIGTLTSRIHKRWTEEYKRDGDETSVSNLAGHVLHLFGKIVTNSNDIVTKEGIDDKYFGKKMTMEDEGMKAVRYIDSYNRYYLSNSSNHNLPSSECVVKMMIDDPRIAKITKGFVGTNNAKSVYNIFEKPQNNLNQYIQSNPILRDEFDYAMFNDHSVEDFDIDVDMKTRILELSNHILEADFDPVSITKNIPDGFVEKLLSISLSKQSSSATKVLTDTTDTTYNICNMFDRVMISLDAVLTVANSVSMLPQNTTIEGKDDLVKNANKLINKVNSLLSSLTFEFFDAFVGMDVNEFNSVYSLIMINLLEYPSDVVQRNMERMKMFHNDVRRYKIKKQIRILIMGEERTKYIKLGTDESQIDLYRIYLMLFIVFSSDNSGYSVDKILRNSPNGNFGSLWRKVIEFSGIPHIK